MLLLPIKWIFSVRGTDTRMRNTTVLECGTLHRLKRDMLVVVLYGCLYLGFLL